MPAPATAHAYTRITRESLHHTFDYYALRSGGRTRGCQADGDFTHLQPCVALTPRETFLPVFTTLNALEAAAGPKEVAL